jgi:hypothetical protein
MRLLVAVLLMLATPLCALAGPRWNAGHGAPPAAYGGAPGRGYQHPEYGNPGRGYPHPGYGAPPRGYERPEYGGPPRGYRGPSPYGEGPAFGEGPYGAPPYGGPSPRTQQQRARDDVRSGRRVPLPFVIERLRRSHGEYVDTREVRDPQGRPMYVLRFRQRGRYVDVPVDAETGAVQR